MKTKQNSRSSLAMLAMFMLAAVGEAQNLLMLAPSSTVSFPENASTSVAWGDYDNDGYIDLFVANTQGANNWLFHNVGGSNFIQTVTGPIVSDGGSSYGGVWGDYDNDGFLDVFVANGPQSSFLYHNDGGTNFTKITSGSLVNEGDRSSFSCAWGDYDRDGYLDLFVANRFNENNFLYHNDGGGTFTKITTGSIVNDGVTSNGCAWGDYDNDGYLDLFVANDLLENNFLYHNNGDGTFTNITSGPVVSDGGNSSGGVWGDYDNDGFLDLFVANNLLENNFLYHNNGDGTFTKITQGDIVNDGGSSRDAAWGDYDNDGYLDLFVANRDFGNDFLYHNNGDGTFTRITTGDAVTDGASSIGCAWGDFNNDGFLDLAVANGGFQSIETNRLYQNIGNSNSWVVLKLIGSISNRAAIGAKVRLCSMLNGRLQWQLREISGGHCRGSQNDLRVHFGLRDATNIDTVRIEWPSGTVQELHDVATKQFLTVTEPPKARPFVRSVNPAPGATGVAKTTTIDATLVDGAALVNTNSIQLRLNGTAVSVSITKTEDVTRVSYKPPAELPVLSSNFVTLIFADSGSPTVSSTNSWSFIVESGGPKALLLTGTPTTSDDLVKSRLQSLGFEVSSVLDTSSQTNDANGKAIIVISSSVLSANINTKFTTVPVPILIWELSLYDDLGIETNDVAGTSVDAQIDIEIVDPKHPLAAGLPAGIVTVLGTPGNIVTLDTLVPSAQIVAQMTDGTGRPTIFGIEKGAALNPNRIATAPARRVGFFLENDTFVNATTNGVKLFDAAVKWAANIGGPAPRFNSPVLAGGNLTLSWIGGGILQEASDVSGPYTNVAGNPQGTYTPPPTGARKFFRIVVP